jgi:hypothetical protein
MAQAALALPDVFEVMDPAGPADRVDTLSAEDSVARWTSLQVGRHGVSGT